MNRIIVITVLFFAYLLSSCDRNGVADNIFEDKLVNQTSKELFFVSYFDVKSDSAYCHAKDSVSLIFIKQVHWSMPFIGPYSIDEGEYPKQQLAIIYNLSDTTIYGKTELADLKKSLSVDSFKLSSRKITHIKFITNNFILSFKKDYTMLDKFKEFYKK